MPILIILLAVVAICLLPLFAAGLKIAIPIATDAAHGVIDLLMFLWPWGFVTIAALIVGTIAYHERQLKRIAALAKTRREESDRRFAEEERLREEKDRVYLLRRREEKELATLLHRELLLTESERGRLAELAAKYPERAAHDRAIYEKRRRMPTAERERRIEELERRLRIKG
jgi:hypothetical protein